MYILLFWGSTFQDFDEVFTYNHMALMSLRSRSRVNTYMVLTRAGHLFMHNYIRSLIDIF